MNTTYRAEVLGDINQDVNIQGYLSKKRLPQRKMVDGRWTPQYTFLLIDGRTVYIDCSVIDKNAQGKIREKCKFRFSDLFS